MRSTGAERALHCLSLATVSDGVVTVDAVDGVVTVDAVDRVVAVDAVAR